METKGQLKFSYSGMCRTLDEDKKTIGDSESMLKNGTTIITGRFQIHYIADTII